MRFAYLALALALAAAALPVPTGAAPDPAVNIAVAPFSSTYYPEYTSPAMASAVTDALVKSGKYNVLARAQLDKVLAEQSLNNSDLVDPKAAQKVGRLLGAKYVVVGSLISVAFQPGFLTKDKYETKVQIQLIETETGSIKVSDSFEAVQSKLGMPRDPATGTLTVAAGIECFENNLKSIAQQFVDRLNLLTPLEGYIVQIEGNRVAINLGAASGVKVGNEFIVFAEGKSIKDPVTGETLSVQKTNLARLVVTAVEPKLAWTTVVATYSPKADVPIAGEMVDLVPPPGLIEPAMAVTLTDSRAALIQKELEKARKKRQK